MAPSYILGGAQTGARPSPLAGGMAMGAGELLGPSDAAATLVAHKRYYAPDALDFANQDVPRFPNFRKAAQDMDKFPIELRLWDLRLPRCCATCFGLRLWGGRSTAASSLTP